MTVPAWVFLCHRNLTFLFLWHWVGREIHKSSCKPSIESLFFSSLHLHDEEEEEDKKSEWLMALTFGQPFTLIKGYPANGRLSRLSFSFLGTLQSVGSWWRRIQKVKSCKLDSSSLSRPFHLADEKVKPTAEKERCSRSYCQAVGFLVIKDDSISERTG